MKLVLGSLTNVLVAQTKTYVSLLAAANQSEFTLIFEHGAL